MGRIRLAAAGAFGIACMAVGAIWGTAIAAGAQEAGEVGSKWMPAGATDTAVFLLRTDQTRLIYCIKNSSIKSPPLCSPARQLP